MRVTPTTEATERRKLQNREAQRRRREKLRRIGLSKEQVRQVVVVEEDDDDDDEDADEEESQKAQEKARREEAVRERERMTRPVALPTTGRSQSLLSSVEVKETAIVPECSLARAYFADKSSVHAQLLMDAVVSNFARWSLEDTQENVRFYLSTQPELFDRLLVALHFIHGLADRRRTGHESPYTADMDPSLFVAVIRLYAARAKQRAESASAFIDTSAKSCSRFSLQMEAQPLFEVVISNAMRLGYSAEEISDVNTVSRAGETFLLASNCPAGGGGGGGTGACNEEALPPASGCGEGKSSHVDWSTVPENMHPTARQMLSIHHPIIDAAFVWPSVRDRVLSLPGPMVDEICYDMIISSMLSGGEENGDDDKIAAGDPPFIVWGQDDDAMDPDSWEVSEKFVRHWAFLFDQSIINRSNWWRKRRGLPPLQLDLLPTPSPSAASSHE